MCVHIDRRHVCEYYKWIKQRMVRVIFIIMKENNIVHQICVSLFLLESLHIVNVK